MNRDFVETLPALSATGAEFLIGVAPGRVDISSGISGGTFDEAWISRIPVSFGGVAASAIGFEALLQNKLASGRPKDLADVAWLRSKSR